MYKKRFHKRKIYKGKHNRKMFNHGRKMKRMNYPRMTRGGFRL
nr:MAG: hypothetical protein [Microviridae sp.]WAE43779.1 MAG: hypothetical protein [Microviridae sp.]